MAPDTVPENGLENGGWNLHRLPRFTPAVAEARLRSSHLVSSVTQHLGASRIAFDEEGRYLTLAETGSFRPPKPAIARSYSSRAVATESRA